MMDTYVLVPQTGTIAINVAGNWRDASTGTGPPAGPPGTTDTALITSQNATIEGGGTVGSLSITGNATLLATSGTSELDIVGLGISPNPADALSATLTVAGQNGASEILAATPSLDLSAPLTIATGGTLQGGTVEVATSLLINGGSFSADSLTIDPGAALILQSGSLSYPTLTIDSGGSVAIDGAVGATANAMFEYITIDPGASLTVYGTAGAQGTLTISIDEKISGAGVISAAIVDDAGNISHFDAPIGIYATGGTLSLDGPVSGISPMSIANSAALALAGADTDPAALLFGTDATLDLQSTATFASALADFTLGDAIDLAALPFEPGTTSISNANGTLTAADPGGQTVTLSYPASGTYYPPEYTYYNPGTQFYVEPDGSGGSYVSLLPLPSPTAPQQARIRAELATLPNETPNAVVWTAGATLAPAVSGDVNIAIATIGGGTYTTPNGYQAAALLGTLATALYGPAGGNALLLANDGADTVVGAAAGDTLMGGAGGSILAVSNNGVAQAGSGADTVVAGAGSNTVLSGGGGMLAFLGGGQNLASAAGGDTIVAGTGSATVNAAAGVLVFAGGGLASVVSAGADTVVAGSGSLYVHSVGTDTVYGGSGALTVSGGASGTAANPEVVRSGSGPMLYAGAGYADVRDSGGSNTVFAGAGGGYVAAAQNDTVTAGTGATTVTGNPGAQLFLQGSANNLLAAGAGQETLSAFSSTGNNLLFAGTGTDLLLGGGGADTFVAATGNAQFAAGTGTGKGDLFAFFNGHTGGSDTITGFRQGTDHVGLYGYASYTVVPGSSETLLLSDGTRVVFAGVSALGPQAFA